MKRALIALVIIVAATGFGMYVRQVIHQTVETARPGQHYVVSLGDSVAAGAGLTDHGREAGCDLSPLAYPFVLGSKLHQPVEQFACSGATVGTSNHGNSLLGNQYQLAKPFLAGGDVVVTAGANDVNWLQALTSCAASNCDANQAQTNQKLQTLHANLLTLLQQVQRYHPRHLVVNTYYGLLSPSDTCFERVGITPVKISFIQQQQSKLNDTIRSAATAAGAQVVSIDFSGHLLCDAAPYIQSLTDRAPLHPTAAGQQHIAEQDAQALAITP